MEIVKVKMVRGVALRPRGRLDELVAICDRFIQVGYVKEGARQNSLDA